MRWAWARTATLLALAAAGASACAHAPPPSPPSPAPPLPPIFSIWPGLQRNAVRLADAGRYADADRLLADFAASRPETGEADEALFWRAIIAADPGNSAPGTPERVAVLDAYLRRGADMPHEVEVRVLRALVVTLDAQRAVADSVAATAAGQERERAGEIRRLSEELERTTAELERIRRRLAPKPEEKKPPPP